MITGLVEIVQELAVVILDDAAQNLLDQLTADAPEATGELKASAYGPTDVGEYSRVIGFSAPQADYTDLGTAPHEIFPLRARALRFFWDNGPNGPDVYTFNQVFHPGQTGTGWFTDTVDTWEDFVQQAIEETA